VDRDSDIATRYGLDGPSFEPCAHKKCYFLCTQTSSGSHAASCKTGTGSLSRG